MTRYLSFPLPVAIFLRRVFNVLSSLAVSNQYLAMRREARRDRDTALIIGGLGLAYQSSDGWANAAVGSSEKLVAASADWLDADHLNSSGSHSQTWRHRLRHLISPKELRTRQAHTLLSSDADEKQPVDESFDADYLSPPPQPPPHDSSREAERPLPLIYKLMHNPTLFDPVRKPRNPVVLCHGLYGYDVRGPSAFPMLQLHYWASVLKVLKKKIGADVIVTGVPGTGSIESRAESLHRFLLEKANGQDVNFLAHSMGGLDCRHLISHVQPKEYRPASLLTICTPHRGSPFMDWCTNNIGIGKLRQTAKDAGMKESESSIAPSAFSLSSLPSSLTTLLLSVLDSPAYANLSTHYLERVFNPATPDDPRVRYYSVAARTASISIWHPLWLPKVVLDSTEEDERARAPPVLRDKADEWGNDGLVSVRSARWGEFLGTLEGCDHWDVRGGSGAFGFSAEGGEREWGVDLALPSGIRNSLSDPFAHVPQVWRDWRRLAGAWRRAEEEKSHDRDRDRERGETPAHAQEKRTGGENREAKDRQDAVVKSSTDKVSAVFNWLADQEPPKDASASASSSSSSSSAHAHTRRAGEERERAGKEREQAARDPRMKFNLERFFVALTRKLYDDGF